MILSNEEVQERIESPLNLLNRLRSRSQSSGDSPCLPPKSQDIIPDIDEKLNSSVESVRKKAAAILSSTLDELKQRIPDVQKPEKLAQIAAEMNKVLVSRDEKSENKTSQIIVYAPQIREENNFETIVVNE